ncbi:aminoglycoside phosphotransferase family protein [Paenibacillus spongiae]|uniref:Aminoglycoside phosphotransferase family protein n=1 Tax=Paenibacillus spongiae TaxID=2909671 RepID=A0ABY5SI46_9BACL|nr:aminoglycoside phosphotransferase family protein [Paenibacillus spongiae]UVI33654.1 aminoglycoside phosphotransferase family protein [Paenibacillus spongiae]
MNNYKTLLKDHYGIEAASILPQKGGWSALAYQVISGERRYFLKVYEKSRTSTPKWTALIDSYVPIIQWLSQQTSLQGKIPVPLLTVNAENRCEDDMGIFQLYEYIVGNTIGDQALNDIQYRQLAEIISELHRYGEEIPLNTEAIKEDFLIPFTPTLTKMLSADFNRLPSDMKALLAPYIETIINRINYLKIVSAQLQNSELQMRVCHTDLHNWNMMQAEEQLILIDWEGLKLAPVEADLMFLMDEPYWNEFLTIYRKTHQHYEINHRALMFYRIRRKLEDIYEFMVQIVYDKQEEQDRAEAVSYLKKELQDIEDLNAGFS